MIGVDPLRYTRVEPVIEKFRSIGMKIRVETGNSYFENGLWDYLKLENFDPKNHTRMERIKHFIHRQNKFYSHCLRTFKIQGFNHTMLIDTDEYFAFNKKGTKTESKANDTITSDVVPLIPQHVGTQNETMAHWIQSRADPIISKLLFDNPKDYCVVIPRLQFPSAETFIPLYERSPSIFRMASMKHTSIHSVFKPVQRLMSCLGNR